MTKSNLPEVLPNSLSFSANLRVLRLKEAKKKSVCILANSFSYIFDSAVKSLVTSPIDCFYIYIFYLREKVIRKAENILQLYKEYFNEL